MYFLLLLLALPLLAVPRAYVANLGPTHVTFAWGETDGQNTIGYSGSGLGPVELRLGSTTFSTSAPWYRVDGLRPDTPYDWQLTRQGQPLASGRIQTWPAQATSLTFFVIGDWGNASRAQRDLALRLEAERQRLESSGQPVRFILSTGDNIYGRGAHDRDWETRFFAPYSDTLRHIPFYAVPGNHDGNESESSADLPAYLDNFFSPTGRLSRWYHFTFGGLAEFFALDTTTNQHPGPPAPVYLPDGEQSRWLAQQLTAPALPWRIAFLHHPFFTAGPRHTPFLTKAPHWLDAFSRHGIAAVFAGHEHNLQFSERNAATRGIQFVVSGAGGEQRRSSVRSRMAANSIAAWSPSVHFLIVHLTPAEISIQPITLDGRPPVDSTGQPVDLPLKIPRRP